jgi:hypothetical protein
MFSTIASVPASELSVAATYTLSGFGAGARKVVVASGDGFTIQVLNDQGNAESVRVLIQGITHGAANSSSWERSLTSAELGTLEVVIDGTNYLLTVRPLAVSFTRDQSAALEDLERLAGEQHKLELTIETIPTTTTTWGMVKTIYR